MAIGQLLYISGIVADRIRIILFQVEKSPAAASPGKLHVSSPRRSDVKAPAQAIRIPTTPADIEMLSARTQNVSLNQVGKLSDFCYKFRVLIPAVIGGVLTLKVSGN